jgi:hypothetical protein
MGTKNNPGAFDCYAKADPDEPMFTLLARDRHAPTLVWLWALLREIDSEEPVKVAEARDCVEDMLRWQIGHGRKTIGIGHAALAGVMGLVRAANAGVKAATNNATRDEELQRILSLTLFDVPQEAKGEICPNCDEELPGGCGGLFKDEGPCRLRQVDDAPMSTVDGKPVHLGEPWPLPANEGGAA